MEDVTSLSEDMRAGSQNYYAKSQNITAMLLETEKELRKFLALFVHILRVYPLLIK
jgi:hypothetical protein